MRYRLLFVLPLLTGCATIALPAGSPDFAVTLEVTDLKEEERELLNKGVCELPRVKDCSLKIVQEAPPAAPTKRRKKKPPPPPPKNATPTVLMSFTYSGDINQLRSDLGKLPHPGLEPRTASAALVFKGFDNLAPRVKVLSPREDDDKIFSKLPVPVELEIDGDDVKEVTVAGVVAVRTVAGPWRAEIEPEDGERRHEVKVVDNDGNERTTTVLTRVDTTPPTCDLKIEVLSDANAMVTGRIFDGTKVTIDGRELELDGNAFETKVRLDPDKRTSRVQLWDEHGNRAVEVWDLDKGERVSRDEGE